MKCQHNIFENRAQHVRGQYLRNISIVLLLGAVVTVSGAGFFLPSGNATLSGNIVPSTGGPSLLWNTTWGGFNDEGGESIAVDGAGNAYVTGDTASWAYGTTDIWIGKYSATGSLLWNTTWGGPGSEYSNGIEVDAAGNAYVCGFTASWTGGDWDLWVGKYDSAGTRLWNVTWSGSNIDQTKDLALDSAGNPYVCGVTDSWSSAGYQVWVGKFDSTTGSILWNTTWGGPLTESGEAIAVDAAGKVYAIGYTLSWSPYGPGDSNIWFGKFDSTSGKLLENNTWAGPDADYGREIAADGFGNIYVIGTSDSWGNGASDVWLGKYNSVGILQWNQTWGGVGPEYGSSVVVDNEGTVYFGGDCKSSTEAFANVWLGTYNAGGEILSSVVWGGSLNDVAYDIALGCNGFAYLAGYTESWGMGGEDILIMAWDVQAPSSCEEWWAVSFLGLPVWGWLVILCEAAVILSFLLSRRKQNPAPRDVRGSK